MNHSVPLPYIVRPASVPIPSLVRARHFKALQGTALQGTSRQVRASHFSHPSVFISPTVPAAVVE